MGTVHMLHLWAVRCRHRPVCCRSTLSARSGELTPRGVRAMPANLRGRVGFWPPAGGRVFSPGRRPKAKPWGRGIQLFPSPGRGDRGVSKGWIPSCPPLAWNPPRPGPAGAGERGGGAYPGFGWKPHPGLNTSGPCRGRDCPGHFRSRSCNGVCAGLLPRGAMSPWIEL